MRQRIEVVVPWLEGFDETFGSGWWLEGDSRLDISLWRLEGIPGPPSGPLSWPVASRESLARMVPYWARFDICLLPVTRETLVWSRLALATASKVGLPPIVLLAKGLSANAVADLMMLDVVDFVLDVASVEECWVRMARHLCRRTASLAPTTPTPYPPVPVAGTPANALREASAVVEYLPPSDAQADPQGLVTQWMGQGVKALLDPERASRDFRLTRGYVVAEFEREYVTTMLHRYGGNVSQASRAGHITRRTFWRLMRKFDISSASYRQTAHLQQVRRWRTLPLKSEAHLIELRPRP